MIVRLIPAFLFALILSVANALALPATSFTYQGQLKDAATPANGTYDLTFSLFDASTAGNQIGTTLTNAAVNVSNGLFTTTLDFGPLAFSNSVRYLEISVRTNTSTGAFTTLAPRQSVTPAPTAIYAAQATSLNSPLPDTQLSTNIPRLDAVSNRFSGALSAEAAVIGEEHTLTASRSGIYGGSGNALTGSGWDSAILGGQGNSISGDGNFFDSTIVGGTENSLFNPLFTTLVGGYFNSIANDTSSTIVGGEYNATSDSVSSTIVGGNNNSILNSRFSAILAGIQNTITDVDEAAILGGAANKIRSGANNSSILGGTLNTVTQPNAIVGGYHAYANNSYTFVWADASSSSDFTTTDSHQFLVRAASGVGINTNHPVSALQVNGTITASAYQGDSSGIALISDHLRLGALVNTGSNAPGYGKALIFSGTPDTSANWNNDNSDPIWMARYNAGDNQSQLRLVLGDDSGIDDKFLIGTSSGGGADFSQAGTWTPKFSIDSSGAVRAAGTIVANTSPDLAETIPAADDVEAGDIVCADPTRREHAIRCAKGDRAILGVISDASGGFLINANGGSPTAALTGKPLVLTGRVPVKVSLENGPIKIGDTLTPSSIPGVAMRATQPGPPVGIALDEYNGSENGNEIGKVLCFVKVGDVNTATVLQQLNADTTRLEKMLTDRDARIAALEKAVTALQQAIQSK